MILRPLLAAIGLFCFALPALADGQVQKIITPADKARLDKYDETRKAALAEAKAGDPADVQHLAHAIDELMYSISSRSPGDSTRVAVLACLHLADKLRAAEKQLQIYEDKSERIATLLEEALDEEAEEALKQA